MKILAIINDALKKCPTVVTDFFCVIKQRKRRDKYLKNNI